jgi:hypothetical protein
MSVSSDPIPPWALPPGPLAGAVASAAPRWREAAAALRRVALEIPSLAHDLAAYHRPDAWQGAVATRFGDDLDRWGTRLGRPEGPSGGLDLVSELLALAGRLEARASAAEAARAAGTADDPVWWAWRGGR